MSKKHGKKQKTLPHVKITITEELLRKFGACPGGLKAILPYLPLTVSTDPEDNIEFACDFATTDRARCGNHDSLWLVVMARESLGWESVEPDNDHHLGGWDAPTDTFSELRRRDWSEDPYVIAQHLAMAADFIDRQRRGLMR